MQIGASAHRDKDHRDRDRRDKDHRDKDGLLILPQILGSLPRICFAAVTHHHHRTWRCAFECVHALRGPRDAALLACRRARPARRRREVLAQLRRRSRVGFARAGSPLERGGGGGTEVLVECRPECRPRGAIEARRQPARWTTRWRDGRDRPVEGQTTR